MSETKTPLTDAALLECDLADDYLELYLDYGPLIALCKRIEAERERLGVLAVKHCPRWHHDTEEIERILGPISLDSTGPAD